ncbi:MAG: GNAT family N-acetyltransferase [Dyadobacter sp.]|uniref:GNAT family N-acetyltransferase n=1 Tax=Dyadobacter sp. TaxID=1914288 RepID=UPI003264CFE5
MNAKFLYSKRLLFIASTPDLLKVELTGNDNLAKLLNANIPTDWPAGDYDHDAILFFLDQLEAGGTEAAGWYGWHVIALPTEDFPATLVAGGGYFGPPNENGLLEIGYSVSEQWRNRGIATEIVATLVSHAWKQLNVTKIIAHSLRQNEASKNVLLKTGFIETESDDPEKLCFETIRPF